MKHNKFGVRLKEEGMPKSVEVKLEDSLTGINTGEKELTFGEF